MCGLSNFMFESNGLVLCETDTTDETRVLVKVIDIGWSKSGCIYFNVNIVFRGSVPTIP